jgi:hypothetical protein
MAKVRPEVVRAKTGMPRLERAQEATSADLGLAIVDPAGGASR